MSTAKDLLLFYFERAGVDTSGDCGAEIEEIVDGVVQEAAEEARRDIIADLFCFTCGVPRAYVPERKSLDNACDCDEYEAGA